MSRHSVSTLRTMPTAIPASQFRVVFHAAKRAALVEIADRIGFQLGLLRHRIVVKILRASGRAIAEVIGAGIVPPAALVVGSAVKNLEMDVGMVEPDPAELHQ